MNENRNWYTYRQAAKRVNRSLTTIKRWRRNGMPMSWDTEGRRIVEHNTLLKNLRETINRDDKHRKNNTETPKTIEDLPNLR